MSKRQRVEHTENCDQPEPHLRWKEQREDELLRPSVILTVERSGVG